MSKSIKIHPIITNDCPSECDANQIPICSKLICEDKDYRTIPKESGTLEDLRKALKKLFAKTEQNSMS